MYMVDNKMYNLISLLHRSHIDFEKSPCSFLREMLFFLKKKVTFLTNWHEAHWGLGKVISLNTDLNVLVGISYGNQPVFVHVINIIGTKSDCIS